ncbi:type VII secretion protein EssB [Ligilactobacillus murinus]|jgi:type VII secretion protein EssB|nr:type VII secretion protein EssB [Ligilactobacillus murinus]TGY52054.1 type VII secretion protein EssB [Ligilactobacillus murinus]WRY38395.1 type VII secretion protein EssB [Ligilactobacillus murinus]
MTMISDGKLELEFKQNKSELKVTLGADKYRLTELAEYKLFLSGDEHYLPGKVLKANEDQLTLSYQLPEKALALTEYVKRFDRAAVLRLLPQLYWVVDEQAGLLQPFIVPENLFVIGQRIVVAHRGFKSSVAPFKETAELRVKQFRALVLYLLEPKQDYAKLVNGAGALRHTFAQQLAKATTITALESLVDQQVMTQEQVAQKTLVTVKKTKFQMLKWIAGIGSVISVILLGVTLFWGFYTVPKAEHIVTAQARFLNDNYADTTKELARYSPEHLPQSARYVLAVSYIQLDTLSSQQKKAVLKNISQNSNSNQLNYWIQIGRGQYTEALSLAKNIGDDEYILHAYTKLYTATKNNTTMDGAKKQAELSKYRKQINEYLKKLGGEKNEFEAD